MMIKLRRKYKAQTAELNDPLEIAERVKNLISWLGNEKKYAIRQCIRISIEVHMGRIKELIQEGGE